MAQKRAFMRFLASTDYADCEDLHHFFDHPIDLAKTIGLAWTDYTGTIDYMEKHLAQFCITHPEDGIRWVPCNLLKYINNNESAYCRRLDRFQETAAMGDQLLILTDDEVAVFGKGALGSCFLSWVACFLFIINEYDSDDEVESEALAVAGFLREPKDTPAESTSETKEKSWGTVSFPQGIDQVASSPTANLGEPEGGPLPEHELLSLSTVVIDDEEFIFLHDLEKQCHLRMDECFSIIATHCTFPYDHDDSSNPLEVLDSIPPDFGEGLITAVTLVKEQVDSAPQSQVPEEEFSAVQAKLVEEQAPVPAEVDDAEKATSSLQEERSSINLEKTANDSDQENVLDMDEWATRGGGVRQVFGPNSALAHYIGLFPKNDIVIVHQAFSPKATFTLFALKALSKVMCCASIAPTANMVVFVKKSLALAVFGKGIRGKVLAGIAIGEALQQDDPKDIAAAILCGEIPLAKKRRTNIIAKRIPKNYH